ncbi:MAG: hypothetical protein C5S45_02215 [Candidatus Methanocomedens sp.]|nr:MAG: hypothetical protein C5S45_02215 [ANME-2 cluster archaeon]
MFEKKYLSMMDFNDKQQENNRWDSVI